MPLSFSEISVGSSWSRRQLAEHWGYKGFEALARGVVTPAGDNNILLFVTEKKKKSTAVSYVDSLEDNLLEWEGPTDHFAERRILGASAAGEQIHLFYRVRHDEPFTYRGLLTLISHQLESIPAPSRFVFELGAFYEASSSPSTLVFDAPIADEDAHEILATYEGRSTQSLVEVRLDQGRFRRLILRLYNRTCCMSGLQVPELLVASHILPWSGNPADRLNPRNGLCLSSLHDKAFDRGLITVRPDLRISVSSKLQTQSTGSDFERHLLDLEGKKIVAPSSFAPDPALLMQHGERHGFS